MAQINIVQLKEAFEEDRLDPEFYKGIIPENKKLIYKKIADILNFIQYGISIDMNENAEGYKIYRMNEIEDMFCSDEVSKFAKISEKEMKTFLLKKNDILFNRTNSFEFVGRTGIFKEFSEEPYIFASYLVRLRTNEKEILPEYLTAFLNCKYGIAEIRRRARISINQSNVSASELKKIKIPIPSMSFQTKIRTILNDAFDKLKQSKKLYNEAEKYFLECIDFNNYKTEHYLTFETTFKKVAENKRLDADYFQPKYDKIIKSLNKFSCSLIKDLFEIKKGVEVGSEAYQEDGIPFIRVSNLNKLEIDTFNQQYISKELYENLKKEFKPKKEEILLSKDGSLGVAYKINEETNSIISGGIIRLIKKDNLKFYLNPDYATLVLNSMPIQELIKRDSGGALIVHWRMGEIESMPIPIIPKGKQDIIAQNIVKSYNLRKEAKNLLEEVKEKVEEFILS